MGTNIQFFVEYDRDQSSAPFSVAGSIQCLSIAHFLLQHDYALFDALAGGRSHSLGVTERPPRFSPRGLPSPVSPQVYYRYYHIVDDPDYSDLPHDQLSSWILLLPTVTSATAAQWIENGWSTLAPIETHALGRPRRRRVSDPDWHSAGWLSLSEIELSLQAHSISETTLQYDFIAVLAAMRALESHLGAGRARSVFWFSN